MTARVTWKDLAAERDRFIGGTLQDLDPDMMPLPETTIVDVVLEDPDDAGEKSFVVVGADYTCSVNTSHGLLGGEYGWILIAAPDVRFRFKAKES